MTTQGRSHRPSPSPSPSHRPSPSPSPSHRPSPSPSPSPSSLSTTPPVPIPSRETRSLIDSLGGGLASNTPRSARAARQQHLLSSIITLKKPPAQTSILASSSQAILQAHKTLPSSSSPTSSHSSSHHLPPSSPPKISTKRSDSSLSDLSDSFDHPTNSSSTLPSIIHSLSQPPQLPSHRSPSASSSLTSPSNDLEPQTKRSSSTHPTIIPSRSGASTPRSSSIRSNPRSHPPPPPPKHHPSLPRPSSLRKTIIQRSHSSSSFALILPSQRHPHHLKLHRVARRLTESQRLELEQTRLSLLRGLEKEEQLINSKEHPILISLEEKVELGKQLRLNQARLKFDRLKNYLDNIHSERQQRIWDTWTDQKIRLQTEMMIDCQIRLNRAPFEFLISNDTTNLQAIFHLTPTPPPAFCKSILNLKQPDLKPFVLLNPIQAHPPPSRSDSDLHPQAHDSDRLAIDSHREVAEEEQEDRIGSNPDGKNDKQKKLGLGLESVKKRKHPIDHHPRLDFSRAHKTLRLGSQPRPPSRSGGGDLQDSNLLDLASDHRRTRTKRVTFDLLEGLDRQKVRHHSIWSLPERQIHDDLRLIHSHSRARDEAYSLTSHS